MNTRTLAFLLFSTMPLIAQLPGSVTGTVVDDSGKPVIRARVFISQALPPTAARPAAPPVITGPHVITTMTDHNGQFLSGHLRPGIYVACAQYAPQGLLDPCHWSTSAPEFTVTAGQATTGVKIVMAKGAIIPIHVDDPHQLLAASSAKAAGQTDLQFHIVTAKGHRYIAPVIATSKNGRDHAITIPFGTSLNVQVISPHLAVNDDAGKPANPAGKSLNVPAATAPASLHYTVIGAK